MRLLLVAIFSVIITVCALAQTNSLPVVLQKHHIGQMHLAPGLSESVLKFEGAVYDDHFGLLPLYIYRSPLPSDRFRLHAYITDEKISTIDHPGINYIADADKLDNNFRVSASIVHLNGIPYAEFLVLPYRKSGSASLEVLDEFTLSYEISDDPDAGRSLTGSFVENSVLAEGEWYRLATSETGIYSITANDLESMGISLSAIDPRKIRLFGNGNGIVPEKNSDPRHDDLVENAIYVHGEDDGIFDPEDYILFYGKAAVKWNYVPFDGYSIFLHELNPYTDQTIYFLNIGQEQGKRINETSNAGLTPDVTVTEFTDYAVHENDEVNILKTGREWYGEKFGEFTTYEYNFNFPNIVTGYQVSLMTNVAAHSTIESNFNYYYGNQHLLEATLSKIILGTTVYAWTVTPDTVGFYPSGDEITIRVEYDRPTTTSSGWMNYIALNARRKLIFTGPEMSFRDHLSTGPGKIAEFVVSGVSDEVAVWDVTDPFNISSLLGTVSGGKFTFKSPIEQIREFIAFDGSEYHGISFIEKVENQNLHSYQPVDYIILSHPDFMEQAERMLNLHRTLDDMSGFIVTPQQVYNEFSSGKQDPSAIRDFVRMIYDRAGEESDPIYLLLLGDASYDYKDRVPNNTNFVPAYQSVDALKLGYSFVTDDYFGLMDPEEGVNAYGKSVEIGIGRFPVHTIEQADNMVNKIESYLTMKPGVLANWRNLIGFVGDDEDQNLHFTQAEKLQHMIDTGQHQYNLTKIYLDAFPQESSPSGHTYPEVNKAIDNLVQKGCLIVNYTGHGGEAGWAHESVLDIPTINKWANWDRLPLFITATCEFTRYDDPSMISAGEYVFLNPKGGGIGLLTTSRLAWADPNFRLNKAVYQFMFKKTDGKHYKVGDVVRLAKTDQNNGTNIKNFVLLGDPAMRLAYPEMNVQTLAINGYEPGGDTLTAMSEVTVEGVITDNYGNPVDAFNGIIQASVFDKDVEMSTLGNDPASIPASFDVLGQKLAEVKARVVNGYFTFSFFMPQSMATSYGLGKISYYAYDTLSMQDAHGYYRVKTGGVNPVVNPDLKGPDLALFLNNTNFVPGSLTDNEPVFLAYLYDEQGINFTGNGIGRDITLTLDGLPQTSVVLNDFFDPDIDNYRSGWISYPLEGLADGRHSLTLKAWDNMNNPAEQSIDFVVNVNGQVSLTGVYNYPNPFDDVTYFVFEHNKPENSFDVEVRIFNIKGQLVRTLRTYCVAEGLSISPIEWDGTDEGGNRLGNGVYLYRMYVTDEQGTRFVQTSKLIYTGIK
ncbi:MAG TPA: type IX secretion system sortase PorU [Bacteroidales bacterium]|nr:type IX secretion system sortase PorU [Bacteroidales bacterium]